jgi:hypothetical protein
MSEAAEYRALADECLGWAKTARSDRERRIFLKMTEAWLEAAALAEKNGYAGVIARTRRTASSNRASSACNRPTARARCRGFKCGFAVTPLYNRSASQLGIL